MSQHIDEMERVWRFARQAYGDSHAFAHPTRLAALAQNDDEVAVALLHDVIEDELATFEDVVDLLGGHDDPRTQAVIVLTRDKERNTYEQYVQKVIDSGSRLAVAVKMYDLFDHIMPNRLGNIGPGHVTKYTAAITQLALSRCAADEGVRNKG